MSDTAGTTPGVPRMPLGTPAGEPPVHEAYSFACMRCGHGWEQEYDIEHHVDGKGQAYVTYRADGRRVPSPLTSPTCANCGGHVVRIMGSGRVSSARAGMFAQTPAAGPLTSRGLLDARGGAGLIPAAGGGTEGEPRERNGEPPDAGIRNGEKRGGEHHWHFADLLRALHLRHH